MLVCYNEVVSKTYIKGVSNMQFSERMSRIQPSAIRDVQKKISKKPGVISFAAGLPDPDLFPLDALAVSTEKMIREKGKEAFQYGLTKGYGPMLDKILERMARKENIHATVDNIIMTTGSQQGLALAAMMFLEEGDIVVAENPSYLGGINACRPYGTSFIGVDTDEDGMDTEQLDKVLSVRRGRWKDEKPLWMLSISTMSW